MLSFHIFTNAVVFMFMFFIGKTCSDGISNTKSYRFEKRIITDIAAFSEIYSGDLAAPHTYFCFLSDSI